MVTTEEKKIVKTNVCTAREERLRNTGCSRPGMLSYMQVNYDPLAVLVVSGEKGRSFALVMAAAAFVLRVCLGHLGGADLAVTVRPHAQHRPRQAPTRRPSPFRPMKGSRSRTRGVARINTAALEESRHSSKTGP